MRRMLLILTAAALMVVLMAASAAPAFAARGYQCGHDYDNKKPCPYYAAGQTGTIWGWGNNENENFKWKPAYG